MDALVRLFLLSIIQAVKQTSSKYPNPWSQATVNFVNTPFHGCKTPAKSTYTFPLSKISAIQKISLVVYGDWNEVPLPVMAAESRISSLRFIVPRLSENA